MDLFSVFRGFLGILLIIGISFVISNNKRNVNWKLVSIGLLIQFILAIFIIKGKALGDFFAPLGWPLVVFEWVSGFFVMLLKFTTEGAYFVFDNLGLGPEDNRSLGYFFAFQVLPTIIFFASLMSIMYYLGIMQRIVQAMAWVMARFMGTSGAESLSCTANIFVGQTEAPLMIKPYLKGMTNSELLTIMVGGMATIAGGVMAAYIKILGQSFADSMQLPLEQAQHIQASLLFLACGFWH